MAAEHSPGPKLVVHPEKTRIMDLRDGADGFDFLGVHRHLVRSRKYGEPYLPRRQSPAQSDYPLRRPHQVSVSAGTRPVPPQASREVDREGCPQGASSDGSPTASFSICGWTPWLSF